MSCDTKTLPKQTLSQRKDEFRLAITKLNTLLIKKQIKPFVGPQGAITFQGWNEQDRGRVSDACAYRMIMSTGLALAKMEIAKAETMAGRNVDKQVVGQGVHSHDGGANWHGKG